MLKTMVATEPCARCHRNPAAGFARIDEEWFCHEGEDPTCYMLEQWQRSGFKNVATRPF